MTEPNLQTEWYALLFASLADAGVTDIVVSPGSRSTPLVVAAVREGRFTLHRVVDERAAAFFALGQARITGRPSVLVCTSGTALAHYLPAIIEADVVGIPMILLTGDRPHELYDCRAPQTIDQVKIFGEHARQFFDLVPEGSVTSLRSLRRIAAQAVLSSRWPRAGAVHLNARARKPLEPRAAATPEEEALVERARAVASTPLTFAAPPVLTPAPEAVLRAADLIGRAQRGVIVAGPANPSQRAAREAVFRLAAATGFAVSAEATSQLRFGPKPEGVRFVDGLPLLLRSPTFRTKASFDVAIQIGAAPTCGAWEQVAPAIPRVVIADHGWNDAASTARVMVFGGVAEGCRALAAAIQESPPRLASDYWPFVERAHEAAWASAERELASFPELVEAVAVRALVDRAPDRSVVVVGNSLAVRLVDIYAHATSRDLTVLSQRGASGIDGLVAGAVGAALSSREPTALLLGDVSLLHDLSSLSLAAQVRTPLVIFVLHNAGGRIFEQLPLASTPDIEPEILELATTPHETDFSLAARLHGIAHTRVTSAEQVSVALEAAYAHAGCTLVEVRLPPSGAIALGRRVASAVEAAVAGLDAREG